MSATDHDAGSNGNFSYFLLSGNPLYFSVNPKTGLVSAVQNLVYSVAPSYTIQIGAKDLGGAFTDGPLSPCFVFAYFYNFLSVS